MSVVFRMLWLILPLVTLFFMVRIVCSVFSSKISGQMRRHPFIHWIWAFFSLPGFFLICGMLSPEVWPPTFVERRTQRQKVLERIQDVGGWEAVRRGCEALTTNSPDGFTWFPLRSVVDV